MKPIRHIRPSLAFFMVSVLALVVGVPPCCVAFSFVSNPFGCHPRRHSTTTVLHSSQVDDSDASAIQWNLFQKYHARGSWKGIWTSYDYMGDQVEETIAAVDMFDRDDNSGGVQQTHRIVVGAKRSDCATCFDTFEVRSIPVAQYTPDNLRTCRLAGCGMVNGPSLLHSGAMATELALVHGDGRIRVVLQYALAWGRGVDPGWGPPIGLKLFRTMVAREALRESAPTKEMEEANPPTEGNPIFQRPVPPFEWHKEWTGTSWTWGPSGGDRGWQIEELEESDAWHGSAPPELWNLRLFGGVFVQAPRIITSSETGLCRLAWLPTPDNLLRIEAGVTVLQPRTVEDDTKVAYAPPKLVSLRCDMLRDYASIGDSEADPREQTHSAQSDVVEQLEEVLEKPSAYGDADTTEDTNYFDKESVIDVELETQSVEELLQVPAAESQVGEDIGLEMGEGGDEVTQGQLVDAGEQQPATDMKDNNIAVDAAEQLPATDMEDNNIAVDAVQQLPATDMEDNSIVAVEAGTKANEQGVVSQAGQRQQQSTPPEAVNVEIGKPDEPETLFKSVPPQLQNLDKVQTMSLVDVDETSDHDLLDGGVASLVESDPIADDTAVTVDGIAEVEMDDPFVEAVTPSLEITSSDQAEPENLVVGHVGQDELAGGLVGQDELKAAINSLGAAVETLSRQVSSIQSALDELRGKSETTDRLLAERITHIQNQLQTDLQSPQAIKSGGTEAKKKKRLSSEQRSSQSNRPQGDVADTDNRAEDNEVVSFFQKLFG